MKCRQLIDLLSQLDPDADICVRDPFNEVYRADQVGQGKLFISHINTANFSYDIISEDYKGSHQSRINSIVIISSEQIKSVVTDDIIIQDSASILEVESAMSSPA